MSRSPFADYIAQYRQGEILFAVGDPGSTLFVVQSGSIDLVNAGGEVLAVMEKGDFFGEMSLLEGSPRPVTARAAETADVIEISPALFDRMIRANIEMAVRMLRKLAIRLAATEGRPSPQISMAPAAPPLEAAAPPAAATPPAPAAPSAPVIPPDQALPIATALPSPAVAARPATPLPSRAKRSGGDRRAAPTPPAPASAQGPAALLLVNPAGNEVFRLEARPGTLHVGRFDPVTGTRPEVDLTLLDLKRSVSRRHAVLTIDDSGYHLTEQVGALNGTTVNGKPLNSGQPMALEDGDEVGFGSVLLNFQIAAP